MKRRRKRILSVVCSMTMIISLLSAIPVRAEEVQTAGSENTEVVNEMDVVTESEMTEVIETEFLETTESLEADESMTEEANFETEQVSTEEIPMDMVTDNETLVQDTESISENTMEMPDVQEENISVVSTNQTYTDENGNIFTYVLDESGNAIITSITVSGAALIIPSEVNGSSVISVANGNNCVVSNPDVKISELVINCHTIGIRAFYGLSIGTLIIGEDVKELCVNNGIHYDYQFYYEQFAESSIDKVVFQAVELVVGHYTGDYADEFYGPFRGTAIGELEIGSNVVLIPEKMFANSILEMDTLEIQTERIGAYAFSGETITIHHLIIGENVKLFEEYSNSTTLFHHWEQFSKANIETFTYLSDAMEIGHTQPVGGSDDLHAPFMSSKIGSLEIGENVTRIPELFLHDANITIPELNLTQTSIGAYAFSGKGISIWTLIFNTTAERLEESYFSTTLFHHWEQFSDSTIGTIKLYAPSLELINAVGKGTSSSHTIYAPFMNATVGGLEIGTAVTFIPDYFLNNSNMDIENLTINASEIGAKAFSSKNISIGTLTIGAEVATFSESYFSKNIFHYWQQFEDCKIGHLIYLAESAVVINDVMEVSGTSPDFHGPFESATIQAFTLGTNVTSIPDYLLKDSIATIKELDLHQSSIGTMAFLGENISIRKLTLGKEVQILQRSLKSGSSTQYWQQFAKATIGEVYYDVPSLQLDGEAEHDKSCYGPFWQSKIGKLYLSEEVERYPSYCFIDAYLEQDALEIHAKSIGLRAFASKNISIGTLTIGTEVQTFENVTSGYFTAFGQFMSCTIGKLVYLPVNASTGTDCDRGVFEMTVIGTLEIHDDVEVIPNYLFYDAVMEQEELTLNVPVIGYYTFASSDIKFHKLIIGESVTTFLTNDSNYSRAFDSNTIGMLYYNATVAKTEKLASGVYGAFSYTTINGLEIGEQVKEIPYGCFRNSYMDIAELTIENAAVGYGAFYSSNIKIGTLNIGNGVNYTGVVSNRLNTFQNATIGTLNYNSNSVEPEWSTSTSSYGMFALSTVGQLNIGEDVKTIPMSWFRSAALAQEELTLSCGLSYGCFYSDKISIGTLTLTGDMAEITHVNSNNMAFAGNTINTVIYDIPSAVFTAPKSSAYGPFFNADITNFILSERVEYIDYRLLRDNEIENCYVYVVNGSESYKGQTLGAGYLPVCTNLYIHFNSDFKEFFSKEVSEYHWLCVDYFDKTYGEKNYNEETGEYEVEIFKTCSICGYEEQSIEELDNSYDVYLSIPIEILLNFDSETKSYTGNEQIYAYGTLGNAYEGIQLVINKEADTYGKAIMEGNGYDISSYLSVGFINGDTATFSSNQLAENADYVTNGAFDALYQEQMNVSVNAAAFIEIGAGEYQISIPLRFELN